VFGPNKGYKTEQVGVEAKLHTYIRDLFSVLRVSWVLLFSPGWRYRTN